jgi:DNA topoisomerase VI subunit B
MNGPTLQRTTFTTSRLLEFTSRKELELQTGQPAALWPLVALKELIDNSLDACEEESIAPQLTVAIRSAKGTITVADNGPGFPAMTVASILDFSSRTSSREAYASPTRGAQGNALKTVVAMPFALGDGEDAITIIEACGIRHSIRLSVDVVKQCPVVTHEQQRIPKKAGTSVTVQWPFSASSEWPAEGGRFVQYLLGDALLNPHASLSVDFDGKRQQWKALDPKWTKWLPSYPTSPHWYDRVRFERLLAAYANQNGSRTVREFVAEFRGLSRSANVAEVLDETELHRITIGELFDDGKPSPHIPALLRAMQRRTSNIKPANLGVIGEPNFRQRFDQLGADLETFVYRRMLIDADIPTVVEAAFAYAPARKSRLMFTGVNFSPAIINPFRQLGSYGEGLERVLAGQRVESDDPVMLAVHLTAPVIAYLDRGKSSIALGGGEREPNVEDEQENPDFYLDEVSSLDDDSVAGQLVNAVKAVTKRWLKQRKAEERDRAAFANRQAALQRARRVTQKEAAYAVMEEAYFAASANDTLPANARQIMYAARPEIQKATNKQLSDTYFTQTLLPDYINEFDPPWKDKVNYDDRGHFSEPTLGRRLDSAPSPCASISPKWPSRSCGLPLTPRWRPMDRAVASAACSLLRRKASTRCSNKWQLPSALIWPPKAARAFRSRPPVNSPTRCALPTTSRFMC